MTRDECVFLASFVVMCLVAAALATALARTAKEALKYAKLAVEHHTRCLALEAELHNLKIAGRIVVEKNEVRLDAQTTNLIALALAEPDEPEGRTAAVLVCKRLKDQMKT
jgi:hypothetical protein